MNQPTFRMLQIASSEALRAGCDESVSKQERMEFLVQAEHFAAKAFMESNQNACFRMLSISQYQCAKALQLIVDSGYESQPSVRTETEMYDHINEHIDAWFERNGLPTNGNS